jgi:16S rRNA (uracil1498-N3)-methyltransferase
LHRIFIRPEQIEEGTVTFSKEERNYLKNVLRLKTGDSLKVLDNQGSEYIVEIDEISRDAVRAIIVEKRVLEASGVSVILGQGIPKGKKLDFIIQKSTELGVDTLVPLVTERTVVRPNERFSAKKPERWKKIAGEAARQCQRKTIPKIYPAMDFQRFLKEFAYAEKRIILWEEKRDVRFSDVLKGLDRIKTVVLVVGPEGGFSREEVTSAEQEGFVSAGLGPLILRSETVPIVALGIVQYVLGNMG